MIMKHTLFLLCLLSLPPASAADISADDFVRQTSAQVIDAVEAARETFDTAPDTLYSKIDNILADAVDFASIARGVIGRHGMAAQPEHLSHFTEVFRKSLVELFSKAMIRLHAQAIDVFPSKMVAADRSKVSMEVTTEDDQTFRLSYALVRTDDAWRVRNIVINGINVGLIYRSQFDALMREYDGDISAAIANWRPTLGDTTRQALGEES